MTSPETSLPGPVEFVLPNTAYTVAIAGLVHALPQAAVMEYSSVNAYISDRLQLPNSVVHYELIDDAESNVPLDETARLLGRYFDLWDDLFTELQVERQEDHVYAHKDSRWFNHDLSVTEMSRMLPRTDLAQRVRYLEAGIKELEALTVAEKRQILPGILEATPDSAGSMVQEFDEAEARWLLADDIRECRAVSGVVAGMEAGYEHFTLLWGKSHVPGIQYLLEKIGFERIVHANKDVPILSNKRNWTKA